MKPTLLFLFVCLVSYYCQAQKTPSEKELETIQRLMSNGHSEMALIKLRRLNSNQNLDDSMYCVLHNWFANAFFIEESYSNAKEAYLALVKRNCGPIQMQYLNMVNLGSVYANLDQYDSALYWYNRAIDLRPQVALGYANAGRVYYSLKNYNHALNCYTKAIDLDSTKVDYYLNRHQLNFISENYIGAYEDLKSIYQLEPERDLDLNLAFCLSRLKRHEEADKVYNRINDNKHPFYLSGYGYNLFMMGKQTKGLKLVQKSLDIQPNNSYAYRNLAEMYLKLHKRSLACSHLQKAEALGYTRQYGNGVQNLIDKNCK